MTNTEIRKSVKEEIRGLLKKAKKLDDNQLLALAKDGVELSQVRALYNRVKKEIKEAKQKELAARLKLQYGKSEFVQKAIYLSDKDLVIFKGLDKNAIIIVKAVDGAINVSAVASVTDKSKKYEFVRDLAKGNLGRIKKALLSLTEGVNFETFKSVILGCSNIEVRESRKGIEKNL